MRFLSTLSLRRATQRVFAMNGADVFLSTLSLRRATGRFWFWDKRQNISIHALLAESDTCTMTAMPTGTYFYPRSPCGERPRVRVRFPAGCGYFYPRSPCGERLTYQNNSGVQVVFLSTLSLRRATHQLWPNQDGCFYFYPRSPCGERLPQCHCRCSCQCISIHALLAESD